MAVPGDVGRCSTVLCVRYRWYSFVVCVPQRLAVAGRGQTAFRVPGRLPGAFIGAVGAVLLWLWLQLELFDVICVALFPPPQ